MRGVILFLAWIVSNSCSRVEQAQTQNNRSLVMDASKQFSLSKLSYGEVLRLRSLVSEEAQETHAMVTSTGKKKFSVERIDGSDILVIPHRIYKEQSALPDREHEQRDLAFKLGIRDAQAAHSGAATTDHEGSDQESEPLSPKMRQVVTVTFGTEPDETIIALGSNSFQIKHRGVVSQAQVLAQPLALEELETIVRQINANPASLSAEAVAKLIASPRSVQYGEVEVIEDHFSSSQPRARAAVRAPRLSQDRALKEAFSGGIQLKRKPQSGSPRGLPTRGPLSEMVDRE